MILWSNFKKESFYFQFRTLHFKNDSTVLDNFSIRTNPVLRGLSTENHPVRRHFRQYGSSTKIRLKCLNNTTMANVRSIVALVVSVGLPLTVAFISIAFGQSGDSDWYRELNKAPWTPPGWVFPVMWSALYALMGVAAWLVWNEGGFAVQGYPLGVYIIQLGLNFLWTPIFFGMHRPDYALVEIVMLWLGIAVTIYLFLPVKPIAAYLLIPYIGWVSIAFSLNWYIWMYNGVDRSGITQPLQFGTSASS